MKVTDLVKLYFKRKPTPGYDNGSAARDRGTNKLIAAGLLRFAPYLLILPIVIFYCKLALRSLAHR